MTDEQVPDPDRKGLTFRRFVGRLRNLGYQVEWRSLNAADYGAPTHRRRLFLIARRDGEPIVWPEPTHADPKRIDATPLFGALKPWRTAAECIDWSLPCPSIFDRQRPLAATTLRRIALGIKRYVLDSPKPFIVSLAHGGGGTFGDSRSHGIDEPLRTVHAGGGNHAVVSPYVVPLTHHGERRTNSVEEPLPTVTGANRGEMALAAPLIARLGQIGGNGAYTNAVCDPLTTITSKGEHLLVAPLLVGAGGASYSAKPRPVDQPKSSVMAGGTHAALVYSFLVKYFGTAIGQPLVEPMGTATGKDRFGLVVVYVEGEPYVIVDIGMRMLTPRELARAQGFDDGYLLTGTKTSQIHKIGNSVSPCVAEALVKANYVPSKAQRKERAL